MFRALAFLQGSILPALYEKSGANVQLPATAAHIYPDDAAASPFLRAEIEFTYSDIAPFLEDPRGDLEERVSRFNSPYLEIKAAESKRGGDLTAHAGVHGIPGAPENPEAIRRAVCRAAKNRIITLSGWRRMRERTAQEESFIKALHQFHGAKPDEPQKRKVFRKVQRFFRILTQLEDAEIVPFGDGTGINIEWRERQLAIESFGDGIAHLLMIAFELARGDGNIILIEEPETHLHPQLQRELLRFIQREQKGNQVIATTHSSVMLDEGHAAGVFLVSHDRDTSHVSRVEGVDALYPVLDQLGLRASDLLQANTVIWVEGPSDRMFLKACVEKESAGLREGVDYQFVFYGGALRSHLSIGGDSRFIDLLRVCRRVVMIADSDRANAGSGIAEAKERLAKECSDAGGLSWITAGREIENYLQPDVVSEAITRLLGTPAQIAFGDFDDFAERVHAAIPSPPVGCKWIANYDANKARLMAEFVTQMDAHPIPDQMDFRARIAQLVKFIKQA